MKKGRIITLSGMSGVGKSYLIKQLLSRTECFEKLKAVTTRQIRDGEINGVDKYFISMQDFVEKDNNGEMCVVNEVFGNMYGYYKKDIEKVYSGINLITELYYSEVPKFKTTYTDTISVYIVPSDIAIAIENLDERNMDSRELEKRISDIKNELAFFAELNTNCFDYILVNDYNIYSVKEFNDYISKTLNININKDLQDDDFLKYIPSDIKREVDEFVAKDKKPIVYTSFDGDDMHYLNDICNDVIKRGEIPLNPEAALGYYVSTVTLGGTKQKVMSDCLTLEMLSDKLYVYRNDDVDISEGIIAEMILWNIIKNQGFSFIHDVRRLENPKDDILSKSELSKWISSQDSVLNQELFHNLLNSYMKQNHESVYLIANFKNFKHIDWARAYCYDNDLCPISPQNILPFSLYKNDENNYLESRLNLLDRVNQVFLFIDRFNEKEEIKNLDKFSLAELYYLKEYCPNKMFTIIGWDQANVPKYDKGKKWSLTSKEDIKVRRLVK